MVGLHTCYNLTLVKKNELAKGIFIEDSNTPTHSLAISQMQTLAPAQALTFTPGLPSMYTNVDL